jgi:quercetin dioxygenase-like cupin family protein
MTAYRIGTRYFTAAVFLVGIVTGGLGITVIDLAAIAAATIPTEHKGLKVAALGAISAKSMQATLGLEGHKLQLRAITIEPGGQIATHSHKTRPGLVKVIDGEWIEGRQSGEVTYAAGNPQAITEDENTVHWFFNRGNKPATALVCDIVPQ